MNGRSRLSALALLMSPWILAGICGAQPAPPPAPMDPAWPADQTTPQPSSSDGTESETEDRPPVEFSDIHDPALRARFEGLAAERLARQGSTGIRMTNEPWLGPTGEQLVGIVNDRMLTKSQLDRRVQLMLELLPPLNDTKLAEDRRVVFESQVLAEWVNNTALAVYAQKLGIAVSDEEIRQAQEQLTRQTTPTDGSQIPDRSRFIGFREDELRRELRDALLAEKVVRRGIHEIVKEEQLLAIYNMRPQMFLVPTRVHVWQLFYPAARVLTRREEKDVQSRMNQWRKRLARASKPEHYRELQKELGGRERLIRRPGPNQGAASDRAGPINAMDEPDKPILIDMGWVAEGDLLPRSIHQQVFKLGPGDTSDIFKSETESSQSALRINQGDGGRVFGFQSPRLDLGYNVVKVDERIDGEHPTFEQARPRVENLVFDQVKPMVCDVARRYLTIYSDSSGLKKWRPLGPVEITAATTPTQTVPSITTAEPNLDDLRRDLNQARGGLSLTPPAVKDVLRRNDERRMNAPAPLSPAGAGN